MVWSQVDSTSYLELVVVLFQILGVLTLAMSRLASSLTWRDWGRTGFVLALIGLGISGAVCGRQDSEFALFAGGTMTLLLIGMTAGNSHSEMSLPGHAFVKADNHLAA